MHVCHSLLFMSLNFYLHKCHTLQQIHANNLEMQMQMSFLSSNFIHFLEQYSNIKGNWQMQ